MEKSGVSKKISPLIIWVFVIMQSAAIIWLLIKQSENTNYKIGFVEISKVYDGFDLTKKLNEDFKVMQTAKSSQLDTLRLKIQTIELEMKNGNNKNATEYKRLMEVYNMVSTQNEKDNLIVQSKYMEQISTQINALLKEYGNEYKYDIILGANGEGSIMHGNDALNITDDVIRYINQSVE